MLHDCIEQNGVMVLDVYYVHVHLQVSKLIRYGADILQPVQVTESCGPGTVADFALTAFKLVGAYKRNDRKWSVL